MKTMRIVTILCWIVAAAAISGLALWFLTGSLFGIGSGKWGVLSSGWRGNWSVSNSISGWETLTGPYEVVGIYNVGQDGVDSVRIDWIAGNVSVEPHDGPDIRITELAQRPLRDDETLRFNTSGSTLTIKFRENGRIGYMPQKRLEVLVPREMSDKLNILHAETTSGNLTIDSFSAGTLKAESLSGNVKVSNVSSRSLDVNTTSGSITVTNARADAAVIEALSGTLRISETTAGSFKCVTTSGNIDASGAFSNAVLESLSGRVTLNNSASGTGLKAETTSGSLTLTGAFSNVDAESLSGTLTIRSAVVPSSLKAGTTSGNLNISIPDTGTVNVYQSTTSGKFSSDVPVVLQNRGAQFELSSLSGNIKIQVYN